VATGRFPFDLLLLLPHPFHTYSFVQYGTMDGASKIGWSVTPRVLTPLLVGNAKGCWGRRAPEKSFST